MQINELARANVNEIETLISWAAQKNAFQCNADLIHLLSRIEAGPGIEGENAIINRQPKFNNKTFLFIYFEPKRTIM